MFKICYLVLTLANGGTPTIVNFNDVIAYTSGEKNFIGIPTNTIYFSATNAIGLASINVKEDAAAIVEKLKTCNPIRDDLQFVFVGE